MAVGNRRSMVLFASFLYFSKISLKIFFLVNIYGVYRLEMPLESFAWKNLVSLYLLAGEETCIPQAYN
jgi:hypothetical protein